MSSDDMEIRIRLSGARSAAGEMKGLKAEVVGTGAATERAGRKSRQAGKAFGTLRGKVGALTSSYRQAAKGVLAAGAAFASYEGVKSSIDTTVMLGKTTIGLTKNLGLSTKAASEWAAVAETRGVDTKALNMSFGKLATNIDNANKGWIKQHEAMAALGHTQKDHLKRQALIAKGSGPQADAFKSIGVSIKTLAGGDFNKILAATADGFARLGPGAERTALSMKLFGRGWQTIVPLLRDGSKGMREQLALADKYGVTFKGKTVSSIQDLISAQREAKFATMGLQVAIGTTLVPILTKALGAFSKFVLQVREGTGAGGRFRDKVEEIWKAAKPVVFWFGRAAKNVGEFAAKHPALVKVAAALFLASKALKLMHFGSALKGLSMLIGRLRTAGETGAGLPGKIGGATGKWNAAGRMAGRAIGAGIGIVAAPAITKAILGGVNDALDSELNRANKVGTVGYLLSTVGIGGGVDAAGNSIPGKGDILGPGSKHYTPGLHPQALAHTPLLTPFVAPGTDRQHPGPHRPSGHHGPGARPKVAEGDTVVHTVVNIGDRPVWEAWERHGRKKANRR